MSTEPRTVFAVVIFIGLITLALIAGAVLLIVNGDAVPESLWTLAGTALGALAAVLVSTRSGGAVAAPADQPVQLP